MNDNPYQDVAKDFLNLWQKQMTSVMGDKQFIHAMLELFQNMQVQPNAKQNTKSSGAESSNSSSDSADASSVEHGVLAELAFRMAMCEKRLAALEAEKSTSKPVVGEAKKRSGAKRSGTKRKVAKGDSVRGKK